MGWDGIGVEEHPVFGKPLKESLKYASVQISTANSNGELYVWGYIPVVVAKWCVIIFSVNTTSATSLEHAVYLVSTLLASLRGYFALRSPRVERIFIYHGNTEAPPSIPTLFLYPLNHPLMLIPSTLR